MGLLWIAAGPWLRRTACAPRQQRFSWGQHGLIRLAADPGLRLNAKGGGMRAGDPLILWPCTVHAHELFDLVGEAIKPRSNELYCLNAEGGAHAGARIVSFPCALDGQAGPNERFEWGADGRIRLREHPDLCLNVKEGEIKLGAELVLWHCGTERWHKHDVFVYDDGLIQLKSDQHYHLNVKGGVAAAAAPAPLVLWKCEPSAHEVFEWSPLDHRIRLKHKREMCVNVEGGLASDSRLVIWPCQAKPQVNERFVYDEVAQAIHPQAVQTLSFSVRGGVLQKGSEIILRTVVDPEIPAPVGTLAEL
uniref:Ricin B lectin domain-containing protein n=1 Tax=Zooxanthella nutricula TaxID=1333877 RepID=A0A7S2KXV4_9DINO